MKAETYEGQLWEEAVQNGYTSVKELAKRRVELKKALRAFNIPYETDAPIDELEMLADHKCVCGCGRTLVEATNCAGMHVRCC